MKKKIIFSTYDDIHNPYYAGGGAVAIAEIAKRLVSEYDVTVITGNYPGAKEERIDGVLYKRMGPSSFGPRRSQLLFHMLLPQYLKKESFDLWIESFTPPFSTSRLQRYTKKPVIGLVHMLSSEDMKRKYKLPFHLVEDRGLKTYNYFIVLTEAFKKKIERVNNNATFFLIPNGVSLVHPAAKREKTEEYILFLGRLEMDQKGIDLLLDGYAHIRSKTKVKLIIAGSGLAHDTKRIEVRIKTLGLQDHVILKGRVAGEEKASLLRNCSVFAMSSRFETFGMVALEAMAYGKPLVSFDIEGLQWIPSSCIIRAKSFDAQQYGEALLRVLNDQTLQNDMSSAALQSVQRYSWDTISEEYRVAIAKVLQNV